MAHRLVLHWREESETVPEDIEQPAGGMQH